MKLPKLPWWGWLLAVYTLAGVAFKFRIWKPSGEGSGLFWVPVFAPVLLLLRWLPDGTPNPVNAPKAFANPGGTATPEELAYTDYLTNWFDPTPDDKFDNAPVSFGEWVTGIRVKTTTSKN